MVDGAENLGLSRTSFEVAFEALAGFKPLSWQTRLYAKYFSNGDLNNWPSVIDIPTGLGKTMVMAIWLTARAKHPDKIPTRLIYVVDRRTVVDQATDLAQRLVQRRLTDWMHDAFNGQPPAISTLRGQLADNREWSADPSRPAIIIGTVDLIGSALLFSGYRSSYKRRPIEAGLLGQDSLLVLDEAHLSKPFEQLLAGRNRDDGTREHGIEQFQHDKGKPMRIIRMSATSDSSTDSKPPFTLLLDANGNLTDEDAADETIAERFGAKKRLTIVTLGEKDKLTDKLASEAIKLAENSSLRGKRIVVFVRKPEDARVITDKIRNHAKPKKTKSNPESQGPYAEVVEVLTGTMRGLERDRLVEKPVLKRFLDGNENPDLEENKKPVFLVSTSAGEVGFDLNADHLIGDATTIDSLIQRLGRVNRRGKGSALVVLVREPVKKKDGKPVELKGVDLAIANTLKLLEDAEEPSESLDVSPKNIAALKSGEWKDSYKDACSPEPTTADLTDILLDAWSMTSITERMPGRPEVGPWLRGIDKEQAQTTIAWRAELELFRDDPAPEKSLRAIFTRHPIRPHESLTVNTSYLLEGFLKQIPKLKDRPSDLMTTRIAVRMPRGQIICRTLQQLIDEPGMLYADSTLILPATFGGLDSSGMLDAEATPKALKPDDPPPRSLDVADHSGYEQRDDASRRLRLLIRRTDDGWIPESVPGVLISERLQLQSTYPTSASLFDGVRTSDLRIRLVQPIEFDEESDTIRSLVMLTRTSNRRKPEDQSLDEHVGAVEAEAIRIADALRLAESNPIRVALLFAARWHDEGKKAEIWQRFVYGPDAVGYKGKSSKTRDPKSLRGYRHEFGSLLRIRHPDRCNTSGCVLPAEPEVRELALHLIATHHGMSRPHFPTAIYRDFNDNERDAIRTEAIRRFARLQRKYGWWHLAWLENLLRCADALASADQDAEDEPVESEGAEP